MTRSTVLKIIGVLILLLLAFIAGAQVTSEIKNREIENLLVEGQDIHTEIERTKNRNKNLASIIDKLETDKTSLKQLIRELRTRPRDVEYITKIETVLVPEERVVEVTTLPAEYTHRIQNIPVAAFKQLSDGYKFITYELAFKTLLVTSEASSTALLQVESSAEPGVLHEVPVSLQVYKNRVRRVFEPHIGVGVTASFPNPSLSGSFVISWWHPKPALDALSGRISLNSTEIKLGLDLVSYNVGTHLPLLTDTWVGIGPDINQRLEPQGSITVWSKF